MSDQRSIRRPVAVAAMVRSDRARRSPRSWGPPSEAASPDTTDGRLFADVRFSTFNASLNRAAAGQLITDLSTPANEQAGNVAEIIQRVRPDILLINEFDFDEDGAALRLFQDNYLSVSRNGSVPDLVPYRYTAPSNTGIPSGFDLDNDGTIGGPGDAYGFGFFPGQFGMAVYSRYPIDTAPDPDVPELPLEGHARLAAADGLVLAGGAGDLPAVVEEPLGRADQGRPAHRPLPGEPPDAAGVRRRRGPQRSTQLRRDPALGRLHLAAGSPATSTTTPVGAAGSSRGRAS